MDMIPPIFATALFSFFILLFLLLKCCFVGRPIPSPSIRQLKISSDQRLLVSKADKRKAKSKTREWKDYFFTHTHAECLVCTHFVPFYRILRYAVHITGKCISKFYNTIFKLIIKVRIPWTDTISQPIAVIKLCTTFCTSLSLSLFGSPSNRI